MEKQALRQFLRNQARAQIPGTLYEIINLGRWLTIRNKIFISYSHADSEYLLRLKTHLKPFERQEKISVWSDHNIQTGDRWRREIESALKNSAVAILLVSADFLASEFITNNELPPLLNACEEEGVKILPVVLKPCAFEETESISQFQSINSPSEPVLSMKEDKKEELWYKISKTATDKLQEFSIMEEEKEVEENNELPDVPESYIEFFSDNGLKWVDVMISGELEDIDDYYVYQYQHIDILDFMPKVEEFLNPFDKSDQLIKKVEEKLKNNGWEGDGVLRFLWIPPFMGVGIEDTWGFLTWVVKQKNNGTTFICSPLPLPFSNLMRQN